MGLYCSCDIERTCVPCTIMQQGAIALASKPASLQAAALGESLLRGITEALPGPLHQDASRHCARKGVERPGLPAVVHWQVVFSGRGTKSG